MRLLLWKGIYRDYVTDMMKQLRGGQPPAPGQPAPPPTAPPPPGTPTTLPSTTQGITGSPELDAAAAREDQKLTQFLGEDQELSFTSLGNVRMHSNIQEGDQMRVSYSLKSCPSVKADEGAAVKKSTTGKCLMRRIWPFLEKDFKLGGKEHVLLENVEDFQLRYMGRGKEGWQKVWLTNERGDATTQDNLPQAVEVTLTTSMNKRKFTMQTVAGLRFPNNAPKGIDPSNPNSPATTLPGSP